MMTDAMSGLFDMVICASVSRFARNISDCIDQITLLKTMHPSKPIGVYFETENIYTLDPNCEQALHIHSMLAQWESATKSRRMILSYDQRILIKQYPLSDLLGYRHTKDGRLIIHEEEAKTVRYIYLAYLCGESFKSIAKDLTEYKRPTLNGRIDWSSAMVRDITENERRWGDLEARKTIVVDYRLRTRIKNQGERDSAYVPGHHEGIVTPEMARALQFTVKSSSSYISGYQELRVIPFGRLKGFVNIKPGWKGINREAVETACKSVYSQQDWEKLIENFCHEVRADLCQGELITIGQDDINFMINPAIKICDGHFKINKKAHEYLEDAKKIRILYHPIKSIIVMLPAVQGEDYMLEK